MKKIMKTVAVASLLALTPGIAFASSGNADRCERGFNPHAYSSYMWIPCWAQAIINHPFD